LKCRNESRPIVYNIADIIKTNYCGWMDKWPVDSLARLYHDSASAPTPEESKDWWVDFDCLYSIVQEKVKNVKPANDVLSLHVRLGDVMDPSWSLKTVPRVDMYKKLIKKVAKENNITKCDIYYGNHRKLFEEESQRYIEHLINIITELGLKHEYISREVDEDFCALATCKHYIPSMRGFSWLTGSINPNNVIWDIFTHKNFPWEVSKKFGKTHLNRQQHKKFRDGIKYQRKLSNQL